MKLSVASTSLLGLSLFAGILVSNSFPFLADSVQAANGQRSLEVKETSGTVKSQSNPVKAGDRLEASGGLSTELGGSATLAVDDGIGTVKVSENSNLQVKTLGKAKDGSRQTRLYLAKGQVNSQVRPFTNPNSSFEIETPGGVAGTRGTEFGVTVGADGKTGLSTTKGKVAFSAKGKTVIVEPGFSAVLIPGLPPTTPRLTTNDTRLKLQILSVTGERQVQVTATTDPVNLVTINNQVVESGGDGQVDTVIPIPADRQLRVVVRTPLGNQQIYELEIPAQ